MLVSDFDPSHLARGKHRLFVELSSSHDGASLGFPALCARGSPGPTLAVLAGIHGDEFEGVAAIHRVFGEANPTDWTGCLLAVPLVNLPAATAISRFSPIDHVNLARVFPGDISGTYSQRLAAAITSCIIRHADLLLDLHSAGAGYSMPTLCGHTWLGDPVSDRSRQAALAFGAPVVWEDCEPAPGRTLAAAQELGIPSVYAETTGGGWLRPGDVAAFARGIRNLLHHLGVCRGDVPTPPEPLFVRGGGDLDFAVRSEQSGFLVNAVELLDRVGAGDRLGTVFNLLGEPIEEVRAPRGGYLMMRRETPMVRTGEMVYALAPERVTLSELEARR